MLEKSLIEENTKYINDFCKATGDTKEKAIERIQNYLNGKPYLLNVFGIHIPLTGNVSQDFKNIIEDFKKKFTID